MSESTLFEKASRLKLRYFTSGKGTLSVEDLWDLSLPQLDEVAKSLNKSVKDGAEESFIKTTKKTKEQTANELAFEIVKHVISVKLEEAEYRKGLSEKLAMKQKLLGIKAEKEDAALKDLSAEEIQKKIDALEV